jgi:hypothetical protein
MLAKRLQMYVTKEIALPKHVVALAVMRLRKIHGESSFGYTTPLTQCNYMTGKESRMGHDASHIIGVRSAK